jgi:hypothetical protein
MQIRLKDSFKGKWRKLQIKIDYAYDIPEYGTDRMGRLKPKTAGFTKLPNGTRVWKFMTM